MLVHYLRSAWRNLAHHRVYSAINILGLGVAIAACVLIGVFVSHERSFDDRIPDKARVYRLNEYLHYDGATPQLAAATGVPIAPFLKANHSEIEDFTRAFPATPWIYPAITLEYGGKKILPGNLICADTSFARFFGLPTLDGNPSFLPAHNSIALTQSLARKLFGNEPATGRIITLRVDDSTAYPMTVTNLLADLPATFHLRADGMIPFPETFNGNTGTSYGSLLGPSYIRLRAGLDPALLADKFTKTIHAKNTGIDIRLQPVKDVHTGSMDINFDVLNEKKMDGKYIRVFILIALAIFLIACANFINLTIAIAAYRGKEIAVKKIMGAGRGRIVFQVFAEAFLAVSLALSLAFILAGICLPFLNTIVGRELPRSVLYSWPVLGMYGVILLGTTLLAGGYPAILISAAKIDQALRTKLLFTRSRTSLRNVLVTGQFAIAVAFIIGLLVFLRQLDYIRNKDLGYSYEQVIRVPLDTRAADRLPLIRAALAPVRGVKELTTGFMNLGGKGSMFGIDYRSPEGKQEHISVNMENGGSNYIRFFRMTLVAGHGFSSDNPHDEYIINESLARLLGHADPVGKEINLAGGFKPGVIVGVVKDFNYSSLHQKIEPLLITSVDFIPVWKSQLYIRVSADGIAQTLPAITAALRPVFHGEAPQVEFMDDHFRQVYNVEEQAGALVAIIGGLAVSIACLGLLSLAAFVVVRRTKEIGIRRVLGASVTGIAASLSREFIRLVAIAFLIAAPLAGWMMDRWLRNYAYRISLGWWIFALAGVIALGIAFATVCGVSIRAARANPVNSLRSE